MRLKGYRRDDSSLSIFGSCVNFWKYAHNLHFKKLNQQKKEGRK
jgi:hypothetical protein